MAVISTHPLTRAFLSKAHATQLDSTLSLFGLVCFVLLLLHLLTPIVNGVWKYFLRPGKSTVKRYGRWAIVTGATDGIGKALSLRLASNGHSLLLISRTHSKLDAVKQEIEAKKFKNVAVKTLAMDFSKALDDNSLNDLQSTLSSLDSIGLLVNNVGMGYDHPDYFHSLTASQIQALIHTNLTSATQMTHDVLPFMLKQRRGCIVNISSFSALVPCPLLAVYAASKQYLNQFTTCLVGEYRNSGIDFQVQNPLYVSTKLAKIKRTSLSVPSAAAFAKASVKAIGYEEQINPYWVHAVQAAFTAHLPAWLLEKITMSMHLAIRKRALKKLSSTFNKTD